MDSEKSMEIKSEKSFEIKEDRLPDSLSNNNFFHRFFNNFSALLLGRINFLDIFDVGDFFQGATFFRIFLSYLSHKKKQFERLIT